MVDKEIISVSPKSTAIKSLLYNKKTLELTVSFTDGVVETYLKVPRKAFDMLIRSDSVGSFFNRVIRNSFGRK